MLLKGQSFFGREQVMRTTKLLAVYFFILNVVFVVATLVLVPPYIAYLLFNNVISLVSSMLAIIALRTCRSILLVPFHCLMGLAMSVSVIFAVRFAAGALNGDINTISIFTTMLNYDAEDIVEGMDEPRAFARIVCLLLLLLSLLGVAVSAVLAAVTAKCIAHLKTEYHLLANGRMYDTTRPSAKSSYLDFNNLL